MKSNSNNKNKPKSKKRLGIILGITLPLVVAGATTGIVFGVKACNKNLREVEVDSSISGVTVQQTVTSSGDIEITLTCTDQGKKIDSIEKIEIGNTILQPSEYEFKDGKIIIKKEVLDNNPGKIIITPKVVAIQVTAISSVVFTGSKGTAGEAYAKEVFASSKLVVKGKINGGNEQTLVIGKHYTVLDHKSTDITSEIISGTYTLPEIADAYTYTVVGAGQVRITKGFKINVVASEKKIELNPTSKTIDYNEDVTITATQTGLTGEINWSSDSTDVTLSKTTGTSITVTSKEVNCVANITATSAEDPTISATCVITVQHVKPFEAKEAILTPDEDLFEEQLIPLEGREPQVITNDPWAGPTKASWKFAEGVETNFDKKFKFTAKPGSFVKEVMVKAGATTFDVEFTAEEWAQLDNYNEITIQPVYVNKKCAIVAANDFTAAFESITLPSDPVEEGGATTQIDIVCEPKEDVTGEIYLAPSSSPTTKLMSTGTIECIKGTFHGTGFSMGWEAWQSIQYDDDIEVHFEKTESTKTQINWSNSEGFETLGISIIKDGTTAEFDETSKTISLKYTCEVSKAKGTELEFFETDLSFYNSKNELVFTTPKLHIIDTDATGKESDTITFDITDFSKITAGETLTPKLRQPKVITIESEISLPNCENGKNPGAVYEGNEIKFSITNYNTESINGSYTLIDSKGQNVAGPNDLSLPYEKESQVTFPIEDWSVINDDATYTIVYNCDLYNNVASVEKASSMPEGFDVTLPGEGEDIKSTIWQRDGTEPYQIEYTYATGTGTPFYCKAELIETLDSGDTQTIYESNIMRIEDGDEGFIEIEPYNLDWAKLKRHELTLNIKEVAHLDIEMGEVPELDCTITSATDHVCEGGSIEIQFTDATKPITIPAKTYKIRISGNSYSEEVVIDKEISIEPGKQDVFSFVLPNFSLFQPGETILLDIEENK